MLGIKTVHSIVKDNRYQYADAETIGMCHLGSFLTDDVGCYSPTFKEMILDPQFDYTSSNYSSLEREGEYIFLGCNFDPNDPPLKIHRDELIKILDAWEQFCKTKPKEIIITQDGEIFDIEGKF